jgi:hypothetical protein
VTIGRTEDAAAQRKVEESRNNMINVIEKQITARAKQLEIGMC